MQVINASYSIRGTAGTENCCSGKCMWSVQLYLKEIFVLVSHQLITNGVFQMKNLLNSNQQTTSGHKFQYLVNEYCYYNVGSEIKQ